MTTPTTLPEALTEIEELRGQVRELLRLLGQEATQDAGAAGVSTSEITGLNGVPEISFAPVSFHRKQTEHEQAQTLAEIRNVIETLPDVIFKLDLRGNLAGWNKRLETVTGFVSEELNGRPALSFVPECEHEQTAAAILRAFEEGYAELEGHLLTKDQRAIPYHWTGAALKSDEGQVVGITGVGRDVSEKKRIEAELRRQQQHLLAAQAMAHIGSWDWDIVSGVMEWSEEQFRIFGYEPKAIPVTSETFLTALHPDDHDHVVASISDMLEGKTSLDVECRIVRPDGEIRTVHYHGKIIRAEDDSPVRLSGSTLDITDRKQAESVLRLSESHFRAMIENSSDIITVLDLDGTIRFESPSFERLLGYTQHEIDGRIAFDFIHPDDLPAAIEKFQLIVQQPGETQTAEFRFRHKDGSWRSLEGIGRATCDSQSRSCVIVNSRDITERKRAERSLLQTRDLLTSFVENTPAAVAMLDRELRYLAVSRRWLTDYRLGDEPLIGRRHYDVFPEIQYMKEWQEIHQRCLSGSVERREEDRFVRADGSEDWLRWEVRPWHDINGEIGGIIMFTEVITERKQAEGALRVSEERLALAVEGSTDILWDAHRLPGEPWYAPQTPIWWSPRVRGLLDLEESELFETLGQWAMRLHPDDKDWVFGKLAAHVEHRVPYDAEYRLRTNRGDYLWIRARGQASWDEQGEIRRMSGSCQDITDRKQVEAVLQQSEAHFRAMIENSSDIITVLDLDGTIRFESPSLERLLGYAQHEIDGRIAFDFIHPDDLPTVLERFQLIVRRPGETHSAEFRFRHKDGCWRQFEGVGRTARDSHDRPCVIVNSRDITERKTIERQRLEQAERLRLAMDIADLATWDWDISTNKVIWSDNYEQVKRLPPGTFDGTFEAYQRLVHPDDLPTLFADINRALAGPDPYHTEHRIVPSGGEIQWIEGNGIVYRNESGQPIRMVGTARNTTARRVVEEALRTSEERFTTAFNEAAIGMALVAPDGHWFEVNQALCQILGYSKEELQSKTFQSLTHPDDLQKSLLLLDRLLCGELHTHQMEKRYLHKEGYTVWAILNVSSVRKKEGQVLYQIAQIQDITERKRAEQLLEAENQVLALMASSRSLPETLTFLCECCESLGHGMLASVLLLDKDGQHLRHSVAPSLPESYNRAIDGVAIGSHGGSCGTAAYFGRQVIVVDIATDPLWEKYRELALSHGLRACWSNPIISNEGQVLGTFALYYRTPREPMPADLHLIDRMTNLTRFAIGRKRGEQALKTSEEKLRQALLASDTGLWDWNTETGEVSLSKEWKSQLGFSETELPDRLETWETRLHPDDRARAVAYAQQYIHNPVGAFRQDFRLLHKDGTYRWIDSHASFITEPDGRRVRLLGSHTDITARKQAEEALLISQERYARATAVGKVGVWELNVLQEQFNADDNLKTLLGYTKEELSTDPLVWLNLVHPDDQAVTLETWDQVLKGLVDSYSYEVRMIRKDGSIIWTHVRGHANRNGAGNIVRLIGATVDVTDRKRADERVLLTQFSIDRASDAVLWMDSGSQILNVNDAACRMLKYTREELIALSIQDLDPNVSDENWAHHWEQLKQQGSKTFESKLWSSTGSVLEMEITANYLRYGGKEYDCAIVRDISERKRAEAELRKSHAFMRQVIDTDPNFIFAKDRDGRFMLVNKATAVVYGTTVDNLIGKTDADFNSNHEEVTKFRLKDLEVMDTLQERFIPEEKITDATGKIRWLQTVKRPLLDAQGHAVMLLGSSTDITARKRVEEMLRQRERDLRAAVQERERISEDLHDGILQSIFAVGLGLESCRTLVSELPLPRKKATAPLMTALNRAIGQLNHVMTDVRHFIAGIESHVLEEADIGETLRAMVQAICASNGTPCRVTIEEAAVRELSTEEAYHVMNVMREALSNSIRHSGAGRITLSFKRLRRSVRLSVTDNGKGFIPDSARDVGHGLINMAARARKLSGRIEVRSRPRQGTKVLLDIPRVSANA